MKQKSVLILSPKTIAAHQVASLMQRYTQSSIVVETDLLAYRVLGCSHITHLVTDIDNLTLNGIAVGKWWQSTYKNASWYAICQGGNTPVMRIARAAGADGFFFLNTAGVSIDPDRGMARLLLAKIPDARPVLPPDTHLCMDIRQRDHALLSAATS